MIINNYLCEKDGLLIRMVISVVFVLCVHQPNEVEFYLLQLFTTLVKSLYFHFLHSGIECFLMN